MSTCNGHRQNIRPEAYGELARPPKVGWRAPAAAAAMLAALAGGYLALGGSDLATVLTQTQRVSRVLSDLGVWGPPGVVGLMCIAIVMSPLPSAPVALASGAAFGHTYGTLYVSLGAELGALVAFAIARVGGFDLVRRWVGPSLVNRLERSQNALMAAVFLSRLMPFVSFDAASYAAGLTPLSAWRFALATAAGILPASFLLAHFGSELAADDGQRFALTLLVLGLVMLVPIALGAARRARRSR